MISFDDFKKTDLRVGRVREAERVSGSDKLVKLMVDIGLEERQIVAGIGKVYDPEVLVGKDIVIVANLEPRTVMGVVSQGMLLAANGDGPALLMPDRAVPPGSTIQ